MNAPEQSYRIKADDGQEYGPVTADVLHQWVAQARANADTLVQPEGLEEWQTLGSLPEFAADLGRPAPVNDRAVAPPEIEPEPQSSGMARTSLVLGILGFFTVGLTAVVGLVLGIVAAIRISGSQGRLKGSGVAMAGMITSGAALVFVPVLAVLLALLLPALAAAREQAQTVQCMNNLKEIGMLTLIHADDDGAFPAAGSWCNTLTNGLAEFQFLDCPKHPDGESSYAYNASLSELPVASVNPRTVMYFESSKGWNAAGGREAMIQPPRHRRGIVICYADGSVEAVSTTRLRSLRWEP